MHGRALAATALLPLLLLSACGDGGDDTQSRSEVIQKANAICRQATTQAKAYTADRSAPQGQVQVRAALQEDVDIANATVKRLEALKPAEEQKADFERFVSGLQGIAAGDAQFVKAIDDGSAIKQASDDAVAAAGKSKQGAQAYGLDDCPAQTVSSEFGAKQKAAAVAIAAASDPIGAWTGRVTQFGPGSKTYHYRVLMTIRDVNTIGKKSGLIGYPSFPCAGYIQLTGRSRNRFIFREHIDSNQDKCPSGGRITTIVDSGTMEWRWVRNGLVVNGTLKRR